eukprot:scaffold92980_cov42-Attheya_sp.AAC.2
MARTTQSHYHIIQLLQNQLLTCLVASFIALSTTTITRLNVVVGPNGTGKSTILCAICLGLGGQPPLLGRADDARLFIMHKKEVATIEIELVPFHGDQTHVLKRVIDNNKGAEKGRGAGASTYYINGTKSNMKEVKTLVTEKYHISVDNLCTFLPQDRVGNFSGFDAQQLLHETEKSLSGSKHLYGTHMKLIDLQKELRSNNNNFETIGEKLETLQKENDRLEREKELMEERKKFMEQMELLNCKKAWLEFDEARAHALELKELRKQTKAELDQAMAAMKPLLDQQGKITSEVERMKARSAALDKGLKKNHTDYDKSTRKGEKFQDEIEEELSNLASIDSAQRRAEKNAADQKLKVEDLQAKLADYPNEEEIDATLAEAHAEIRELKRNLDVAKREHGHVHRQLQEIADNCGRSEQKLEGMNDEKSRRTERIFRQQPKLHQTYQWIDQNRKMFRRPVLGPIVCEVTPKGVNAAAYLEQHVSNNILKAYVVECKEDYNLLYREVRGKLKLPINVVTVPNGTLNQVTPMYTQEKMNMLKNQHGVMGYLDESFTGPDAVLQALRDHASVHKVLVGSSKTHESMDRHNLLDLLSQKEDGSRGLMGSCIFTSQGNRSYKSTTNISAYSKKASTRGDEVMPPKMLAPGTNPQVKAELEDLIDQQKRQIEELRPKEIETKSRQEAMNQEGQATNQRSREAKAVKNDIRNIRSKLDHATRKLQEYEESAKKDNMTEKKATVAKVRRHFVGCMTALQNAGEAHTKLMKDNYTLAGVKMTEDGLRAAERKTNDAISEVQKVLKNTKNLRAKATEMVDIHNDPVMRAKLEELPETLPEVEAALDEATLKVNSTTDNPEVLVQYEQRKREIVETREELEGLSFAKEAKRVNLEKMKDPWESALKNTVTKVNTLFEKYMTELGFAGEVRLAKGEPISGEDGREEESNFEDWGIEIRVKFREKSSLQTLSAHVHSGGERSVSTIMYLMALQELMVSPFRCVDEINQGLDERNERLVFRRIVANSTQPPKIPSDPLSHAGQYFLITPKLLPNLTDMENEDVTVLFIFNGPFNFRHFSDWNPDKFVKGISETPGDEGEDNLGNNNTSSKATKHSYDDGDGEDEKENNVNARDGGLPSSRSSRKKMRVVGAPH